VRLDWGSKGMDHAIQEREEREEEELDVELTIV
jgi:hypothetical protein